MDLASRCETGVLYCGDNLERLAQLPPECVDLIYLDPPFFSNRNYEVIWGDEAEVRSFEDRWEGGINHYVEWMWDRVIEMHRVLKQTGSLYLHCDWHASHHLKVMADEVFGARNFRAEITWKRHSGHNDARRTYPSVTDTILFYAKSEATSFNVQRTAHRPEYVEKFFRNVDERGRRYTLNSLKSPSPRPNLTYEYKGYPPPPTGWTCNRERMEEYERQGRLEFPKKPGGRIRLRYFLDEMQKPPVTNLWDDVPALSGHHAERLGYPTQKPVALLERIVRASSNPGDVVLDPFCGCGTTLVAAQRLNRQWIGIDISPTAVNLMKRRLEREGASGISLVGMPVTEAQLKALKPFEFQNWVIQRLNGTHSPRKSRDMGIDGYSFFEHDPIQVKRSEHVGRNVIDNFETAVERAGKNKGYIVAFSFTRDAREEVSRVKRAKGFEIELIKVADLLEDTSNLVMPAPEPSILGLPLPKPPPKEARPSAEELVESDQGAGQVA